MRRNNLAVLILGLVVGGFGCGQPAQQRVYVDFEAVLASYSASPLPTHALPKPPGGLPPQVVSIPAVTPRTVVVQGTSGDQAQRLLEQNRKKAVDELTALLTRRYVREAERAGEKNVRDLDPKRKAAYDAARDAVHQEFLGYATQRSPLISHLVSIVGFPDPNPKSLPPPDSTPQYALPRLAQAADLRKQIATLDADYRTKVRSIFAKVESDYNVDLVLIQNQIETDRAAAMKRAESEAVTEAAKTYASMRPIIMGPAEVNLPGQPSQSLELPAVSPPMAAPNVRERTLTADQKRSILQSQLQMWAKLNGYELAKTPEGAKDMTADFVKWRQERKL